MGGPREVPPSSAKTLDRSRTIECFFEKAVSTSSIGIELLVPTVPRGTTRMTSIALMLMSRVPEETILGRFVERSPNAALPPAGQARVVVVVVVLNDAAWDDATTSEGKIRSTR